MGDVKNIGDMDIGKYLVDLFGSEIVEDIMKAWQRKLEIITEIEDMNLPVDDWDKMEEEIIMGALE